MNIWLKDSVSLFCRSSAYLRRPVITSLCVFAIIAFCLFFLKTTILPFLPKCWMETFRNIPYVDENKSAVKERKNWMYSLILCLWQILIYTLFQFSPSKTGLVNLLCDTIRQGEEIQLNNFSSILILIFRYLVIALLISSILRAFIIKGVLLLHSLYLQYSDLYAVAQQEIISYNVTELALETKK